MSLMYSGEDLHGAATKGDALGVSLGLIGGAICYVGAGAVTFVLFEKHLATPAVDEANQNAMVMGPPLAAIFMYATVMILMQLVTRAGLGLLKVIRGEGSFDVRGLAPALCRASAVAIPRTYRELYAEEWAGWFYDMRVADEPLYRQLSLACSICRGVPALALTLWLGRFRARIR